MDQLDSQSGYSLFQDKHHCQARLVCPNHHQSGPELVCQHLQRERNLSNIYSTHASFFSFTYLHSPIPVVCRLLHCLVWQRSPDKQCPRYCCGRSPLDLHTYYYHQQASHLLQCNFLKKAKYHQLGIICMCMGQPNFQLWYQDFIHCKHSSPTAAKLYLSLDLVPHTNWLSVCLEALLLHTCRLLMRGVTD